MPFKKRHIEGLTSAAPVVLGTVGLGAVYGKVHAMIVQNFASSAKSGAGTDTAGRIELKDADGRIFYLDAADRDYATAAVRLNFNRDTTATGLTDGTYVDATGAAWTIAAEQTTDHYLLRGPITVTARNFGTATDYLSIDLLVEI